MEMTTVTRRFNSIGAFVRHVEAIDTEKGAAFRSNDDKDPWFGGVSFEEACHAARFGTWEPPVPIDSTFDIDVFIPHIRRYQAETSERRHDVGGHMVDIARFCEGEPEHMWDYLPNEEMVEKHTMCLLLGMGASSAVSGETLTARGGAIFGLMQALSVLGFELEVWADASIEKNNVQHSTLVRLHAAGEIMDQSALVFPLVNPGWKRRLVFRNREGEPRKLRSKIQAYAGGGYGTPTPTPHRETVDADIVLEYDDDRAFDRDPYVFVWKQLVAAGVIPADAEMPDFHKD